MFGLTLTALYLLALMIAFAIFKEHNPNPDEFGDTAVTSRALLWPIVLSMLTLRLTLPIAIRGFIKAGNWIHREFYK